MTQDSNSETQSETKGLEGTVTIDKEAGYYAEILAYKAMEDVAKQIARKLKTKLLNGPLIILGKVDLAAEAALWNILKIKLDVVTEALDMAIEKYSEKVKGKKVDFRKILLTVLKAVPDILGSVADIAAFFTSYLTITSKTISINEQALISAVTYEIHIINEGIKIILPKRNLTGEGELLKGIHELMTKRSKLLAIKEDQNRIFNDEIKINPDTLIKLEARKTVLNKIIDKAIADGKDTTILLKQLQQLAVDINNHIVDARIQTTIITDLNKNITAAEELIKVFTEKPVDKLSPLESVASIEQIKENPDAKLLYLLIVSQGGEIETSKTNLTQGRVSYLGGTVISYILTNIKGECLSSGNEQRIRTATFKRNKGIVKMKKGAEN